MNYNTIWRQGHLAPPAEIENYFEVPDGLAESYCTWNTKGSSVRRFDVDELGQSGNIGGASGLGDTREVLIDAFVSMDSGMKLETCLERKCRQTEQDLIQGANWIERDKQSSSPHEDLVPVLALPDVEMQSKLLWPDGKFQNRGCEDRKVHVAVRKNLATVHGDLGGVEAIVEYPN
ncbi:hypothetical protein BDK51DRAFT_31218 [Blyttiomyces helicus]|uniref:Uncharacterized protein n=1 Tax=Blyttiomyces helicus TaxID=388810 RepID=A0A4P9W1K0_9FUNG|nr:hypothetical protein BDK51DRAFT_31218 [Blyttiomyces helicus]|eukprot:RKO84450.1 hypothetical protein BDK51DRAFT_31218 [Blyttiomyces helicus]